MENRVKLSTVTLSLLLACGGSTPTPDTPPTEAKTNARAKKREDKRRKRAERIAAAPKGPFETLGAPSVPLSRDDAPDVLFITWDTTRVDHLSTYGYYRPTSPWLTEFASEAVRFDWWIVPMSTTLPSHTTMFTGLQPGEHGILANAMVTGERFVPSEKMESLPAFLGERGYLVAGFVGAAPLKKTSGMSAGFHVWSEPAQPSRLGGETVDNAIAWLDQAPDDRPVFLWVHFYDPHYPYKSSPKYKSMFKTDDQARENALARGIITSKDGGDKRLGPINIYDGQIRYTDDQTRRLVDRWKTERGWDRTIAVLAADHGEGLHQHGHHQHGVTWHEQLHSPLLIRAPGVEARVVDQPVAGHDLLPTMLGMVDLPDEDVLIAQATGQDVLASSFQVKPVFSRTSARQTKHGAPDLYALTDRTTKAVLHPDSRVELYDLSTDPHELTDIAKRDPERAEKARVAIERMLAEQQARADALGAGKMEKLDDQTLSELAELGYLE